MTCKCITIRTAIPPRLTPSGGARKIIKPGQKFKEDNAVSEHHHRSHIFPTIHALSTNRLKKN